MAPESIDPDLDDLLHDISVEKALEQRDELA